MNRTVREGRKIRIQKIQERRSQTALRVTKVAGAGIGACLLVAVLVAASDVSTAAVSLALAAVGTAGAIWNETDRRRHRKAVRLLVADTP